MAICLKRSFKSIRSFAFTNKRHQQTNFFDRKKSRAVATALSKQAAYEYFPITPVDSCKSHQKILGNLQDFSYIMTQGGNFNFNNYQSKNASHAFDNMKLNYLNLKENHAYCTCNVDQDQNVNNLGKPNQKQLENIHNILVEDLSKLFTKNMNYAIYHPDVIFENNIRGTKSRGIFGYVKEMALVKIVGHIKFANVQFKILKTTTHPEDGTVRVRWRIVGISNYKAFFFFIKQKFKNSELEGWYDGFSIFYVHSDGLIHKHIVDKMMPDNEEKIPSVKDRLVVKMALVTGLVINDFANTSLSFEEILEKYPNLPEFFQTTENLNFKQTQTADTQTYISELSLKPT